MKFIPLAFESLGVRSMATFIQTDQKILVDPGTSLAPKRFGFPPWKTEYEALYKTRATIEEYAKLADILTISHYHHDHFTPFNMDRYLDSSPKSAEKIYDNKKLFIKNPHSQINKNQKKRANELLKNLKELNCEISYADGETFEVGNTSIKFSKGLPHGPFGSRMGFLIALTVSWKNQSLMHASDVQGPIYNGTQKFILDETPDILILSGPPIYLMGFALEKREVEMARENLIELSQEVPKIVVDHHLLRDVRCFEFIKSVKKEACGEILVASEIIGEKPYLLEAKRKELYYKS